MRFVKLVDKRLLVIPGHVNKDAGALIPPGLGQQTAVRYETEAEINLDIWRYMIEHLRAHTSAQVHVAHGDFTRKHLTAEASRPDLTLEIHCNAASGPEARGMEIWHDGDESSIDAARLILKRLSRNNPIGLRQPSIKDIEADSNEDDWRDKSDALFEIVKVRPLILIEYGFLSNPIDLRLLTNSGYQSAIAYKTVQGIDDFFSMTGSRTATPGAGGGNP